MLRFSQIRHTNPDRYMYYEYGSKSHPGGIADPTEEKIVPISATNTSRCHVAILNFYFSKVPPLAIKSDSLFYMKPMPFTPTGIKTWFWDENFPKTKLSTVLKTMLKEANISGNFTNHSLCVTGTPEAIIQKRTGHGSLSALRMYMRELLLSNKQWFPLSLPTSHLQRVNKLIQAKLVQASIRLAINSTWIPLIPRMTWKCF